MAGDQQVGKAKKDKKTKADTPDRGWKDGKFTYPLRKSVFAYDEERTSIEFREPIGEDIIACGNPVIVNMLVDPPDVKFDDARMGAMMSRLAGVPISAIGKMDPQDFAAASWILAPFFLPMG